MGESEKEREREITQEFTRAAPSSVGQVFSLPLHVHSIQFVSTLPPSHMWTCERFGRIKVFRAVRNLCTDPASLVLHSFLFFGDGDGDDADATTATTKNRAQ